MKLVLMECGLWGFVKGKETTPNRIVTDTVPAEHLRLIVPFKCMFHEIFSVKDWLGRSSARKSHLKLEGINGRYEDILKPSVP